MARPKAKKSGNAPKKLQNRARVVSLDGVFRRAGKTAPFKNSLTFREALRKDLTRSVDEIERHGSVDQEQLPIGLATSLETKRRIRVVEENAANDTWIKNMKDGQHPYRKNKRTLLPETGIVKINGQEHYTTGKIISMAGSNSPFKSPQELTEYIRRLRLRTEKLSGGEFRPLGLPKLNGVKNYSKGKRKNAGLVVEGKKAKKWILKLSQGVNPLNSKEALPGRWKNSNGEKYSTLSHAEKGTNIPHDTMRGAVLRHFDSTRTLPEGVEEVNWGKTKIFLISDGRLALWGERYSAGMNLIKPGEKIKAQAQFVDENGKKIWKDAIRLRDTGEVTGGVLSRDSVASAIKGERIPKRYIGRNSLFPRMKFVDKKYLEDSAERKKNGKLPYHIEQKNISLVSKNSGEKFRPVSNIKELSNGHIKNSKEFNLLRRRGRIPDSEVIEYKDGGKRLAISERFLSLMTQRDKRGLTSVPTKAEIELHGHGMSDVGSPEWAKDNKGAFKQYIELESAIKANNLGPAELKRNLRERNKLLEDMGLNLNNNRRDPDEVILQGLNFLRDSENLTT